MKNFQEFCRRNVYNGLVCLGIGGGVELISEKLPNPFAFWISLAGMLIAIAGGVVCAVGLIGNKPNKSN